MNQCPEHERFGNPSSRELAGRVGAQDVVVKSADPQAPGCSRCEPCEPTIPNHTARTFIGEHLLMLMMSARVTQTSLFQAHAQQPQKRWFVYSITRFEWEACGVRILSLKSFRFTCAQSSPCFCKMAGPNIGMRTCDNRGRKMPSFWTHL